MISLTLEQWRRAEVLVLEALDAAPEARVDVLERACAGDQNLKAAIEELLRIDQQQGSFLDTPLMQPRRILSPASKDPWCGRQLGPYRLVQAIGSGGMSQVYLAERADDEVEQRVAIKVLPSAEHRPFRIQMLRQERRILARLDHPNIARFLDGGTTPDGQPYFVMEYIEGVPIEEYCDRKRLTIDQRLALFLFVCRAVESAHRQLVVHRDLKPSNILVDDSGAPKLLDFGIAKLLSGTAGAERTVTQERFLTPPYASPEQRGGEPVSTASDIYSLGVLLFQLLTGSLPTAHRTGEPPRPSSFLAVSEGGDDVGDVSALAELATLRRTSLAQLRRALRGDLDAIVTRCMRPEPGERYPSVSRLVDDLRRFRDGHPVSARAGSAWYRIRKFVGRHRLALAVSTAAILALLALTLTTWVQSRRVQREREVAESARQESLELTNILLGSIQRANPYLQPDPEAEVTVRQLLDETVERVRGGLSGQPLVRASVLHTLGAVYADLGRPHLALELFRDAFELRRETLGWEDLIIAGSLNGMAIAYRDVGQFRQALVFHRAAATLARKLEPGDTHQLAEGLRGSALSLMAVGVYAQATEPLEESLAIRQRLLGPDHRAVVLTRLELSTLYFRSGALRLAESTCREVLRALRKLVGEEHPDVATAMHQLASTLIELEEIDEALALQRRSLEIRQRIQGEEHPETLSTAQGLAAHLSVAGRVDEAEEILRHTMAANLVLGASRRIELAHGFYLLGDLLRRRGEFLDARAALEEAVTRYRAFYGAEGVKLLLPRARLAQVMGELGAPEAEVRLREVHDLAQATLGPKHYLTARIAILHAESLARHGRCPEVNRQMTAAQATLELALPPEHSAIAEARRLAAGCQDVQ